MSFFGILAYFYREQGVFKQLEYIYTAEVVEWSRACLETLDGRYRAGRLREKAELGCGNPCRIEVKAFHLTLVRDRLSFFAIFLI